MAAGTRRILQFNVTYSANWSVVLKQNSAVLAADVTAATFLLKNPRTQADASAAVTKTLSAGIAKANGVITVTLNPADTKDLEGTYYGTLRLYLADSGVVDFEDSSYADIPYIQLSITQGAVEATS
jgi:hypothetical protein